MVDGPPIRGDARHPDAVDRRPPTVLALFLAGFGTYELLGRRRRRPGAEPARRARRPPRAGAAPGAGDRPAVAVHLPLSGATAASRPRTSCCPANTADRAARDVARRDPLVLGLRARRQGRRQPGVDNVAYVTTKDPLTFDIHCAELCGLCHGYMFDTGQVVSAPSSRPGSRSSRRSSRRSPNTCRRTRRTYLPEPARRGWMSSDAVASRAAARCGGACSASTC